MMETMITYVVIAGIFGLFFGSFAGATVWRIRARQLVADKKAGEKVSSKELKTLQPLTKETLATDRSRCLHCGHTLAWYDLIPLVSWLSTAGKCRYCHKTIGWFEPAIEIGTAVIFSLVTFFTVQTGHGGGILLIVWLAISLGLIILLAYDAKWFLLPDVIMMPLIGLATVVALLDVVAQSDVLRAALNCLGSVMLLGGLYFMLYGYSRWRFGEDKTWVGFGDVKLGLVLGLLLGDWQLAFIALFAANAIGVIAVLPSLVTKKLSMTARVPFGPLLIIGFFIALFFGSHIIDWYAHLI